MRGFRRATVALVAALALAGCTASPAPAPSSTAAAPGAASSPASTHPASGLAHVVVIVLENKPSSRILGSSEAPYLNGLAKRGALATDYSAIRHPSLPNYLAMTSGTTAGVTDDCDPDACGTSARTIAHEVTASGRSWRMYAEAMPAPCTMHNDGRYAVRHNPFLYDSGVTGDEAGCAAHDVPYSRLAADLAAGDLPDLAFISPDLCNDMHDCDVATGDAWLSREVPKILDSSAFRSSRSLLVVTFDEGVDEDNHVVTVFAGPAAKAGARSSRPYTHYSLLRTVEDAWHLKPLADGDGGASPMTDLLR
jgi:acid phosphatase